MEKNKKKYADLTVLYLDSGGGYISTAERLARDFGTVYYFCPNYGGSPSLNRSMIGEGLKDVHVVEQWFYKWHDYKGEDGGYDFNKVDLFIFADIYMGDIQMHLINDCKKTVWGSRKAEELELLRIETKQKMKGIGLPVTPTKLFKSFLELFKFLSGENKERFLKLSWFRGIMESAKFKSLVESLGILAALQKTLEECYADKGQNAMELIAEKPIDSEIEIGCDTHSIDGEIPKEIQLGLEVKNKLYVATHQPFEKMPKQLKYTLKGLCKLIKDYGKNGCRSWICTEVRIDKKTGEGHLIDITMRQGCPPSELQQEWIENYSEIIYEGAKGNVIEPIFKTKYAAQVAIYSPYVNEAQILKVPDEVKQWVKLFQYCGVDKEGSQEYGIIPVEDTHEAVTELGYIVGIGETIDECFENIKKVSEKVEGSHLEFQFSAMDDFKKEQEAMKRLKIEF